MAACCILGSINPFVKKKQQQNNNNNNNKTMFIPNAYLLHLCKLISVSGMIGFWPLSEASYGKNLVRDGPDVQLHGVQFTEDAGPWRSSPAQFQGSSYATGGGDDLITHSFSWMGAVWFDHYHTGFLLTDNSADGSDWGLRVNLQSARVYAGIRYGSCSNGLTHSVILSLGEWHIIAAAADYENKILSVWADGYIDTWPLNTCDTSAGRGNTFYFGKRCVL